ncbi:MAG: hypothetical protein LBC68_14390 [Prevotellaceae bacterium]|jgi:hypothetical protein|nr:hypothetical protein [Prevotellaceae bacterium]
MSIIAVQQILKNKMEENPLNQDKHITGTIKIQPIRVNKIATTTDTSGWQNIL